MRNAKQRMPETLALQSNAERRRPPRILPRIHVETRKLTLRYGPHVAFRDITLPIRQGEITAIVGPSGCGKSSFLACLNRLTDLFTDCHVTGSATLVGEELVGTEIDLTSLRRRVGMIFQKPNPFPLTIRRNLELPLREHAVSDRHEVQSRMEEVLRAVGLWDEVHARLDTPALRLSGGQQQRLCIARALVLRPEVLLLDEPCSALDPISSGVVEDLIHRLRETYTLVIVTHNLAQARRIADHVALFWVKDGAGHLAEHSRCRDFFESPKCELTAAYVRGARG